MYRLVNYIVAYDLASPGLSHDDVDSLLAEIGESRGQVLESVWWVDFKGTQAELRDHILKVFGSYDSVLIVQCSKAAWTNLLVDGRAFKEAWREAT